MTPAAALPVNPNGLDCAARGLSPDANTALPPANLARCRCDSRIGPCRGTAGRSGRALRSRCSTDRAISGPNCSSAHRVEARDSEGTDCWLAREVTTRRGVEKRQTGPCHGALGRGGGKAHRPLGSRGLIVQTWAQSRPRRGAPRGKRLAVRATTQTCRSHGRPRGFVPAARRGARTMRRRTTCSSGARLAVLAPPAEHARSADRVRSESSEGGHWPVPAEIRTKVSGRESGSGHPSGLPLGAAAAAARPHGRRPGPREPGSPEMTWLVHHHRSAGLRPGKSSTGWATDQG
jgi:hypothetical protein